MKTHADNQSQTHREIVFHETIPHLMAFRILLLKNLSSIGTFITGIINEVSSGVFLINLN